MIGHSNKQHLKEEAMKARQAQAKQSLPPTIAMNATLFHAPRRVEHNSNTGIMGQIHKVLGNYKEGVEEIGKRAGHIYEVRPQSRDANNQQKYKGRLNGVNRPTPTPQHNNNSVPGGRGHDSRHGTSDLPQLMHDESKSFQNSSSSLPSKESEPVRNSLDASSLSRNSQPLRPSSASRQPSEKHATEKDGPSSLTYQQKNKYASSYPNFNHKSHPSSSSSHNHPSASGLGSSSGGGGTKSSRPSSSISTDSHHSSKSAVHGSEKHPSGGVPDKHHGNITKTYPDLKAHNEKSHGDASDGKSLSNSSERNLVHSMLSKVRSSSPSSLPPLKQKSRLASPLLSQSRQGPPLLQPQQTLQQLPPQLQHQQPPTIIPVTTGSDICDENHHSSPSISPSSVFNATNRVKSLPSQLTPQHISKDSSLPENLFSGEDNDVNRIVREMTSQPEKLTAIKTPIKSASLGSKTKPDKDKIVSSSDKTTMPKLTVNQNPGLKNRSRPEVAKNLHGSNVNNLSSDDADLTEMKDKTELDKIIAEMTCIKSPISIILTPEKIKNTQLPFLKTINSDLAVSDSEGSASDADERRPSDEKPCKGSSSDEEINYNTKQLDFSREKEAITEEVKNHMPLMLSPMLDDEPLNADPLRGQEDLSQDLQMSDSDNESIKSEASLSSQHQPSLLTCNSGGFAIPPLSENDSDDEMEEDICKNPAADAHNSEVPDEVAATTDPTHFYGTPQVCAPTARKGSRESPHKTSDNEESDDDDDSDDDNEEEEKAKQIKSEDDTSAAGSEALQEKEADQGSSSSTSCTESTEDESEGSDEEEEEPHLNPSPPSHPAKPTTEGEHCDSSSSMSWGLRGFITKPLEIKQPKVTDPQTKSESDNCSSKANSNHSSPSNKYSSDDSSSDSSNSFSNQENPSHTSLPTASPDKSSLLSDGEELHDGNDSVKRSSISSSGMDEVTPVNKTKVLVSDASTKVTPTTSASAVITSTTLSNTTSSTTKVQDCLSVKIQKKHLNSASTPTSMPVSSPTSSLVERKRKRKVILLPISINLDLLSSPPEKKRKLSPEPSQPAENIHVAKLEPVPCLQSSSQPRPNAAVDKKIRPPNLQKRGRIASANSCRKKKVIVKINVKLMNLVPKNCKGGPHPSRKSAISKSPAGLASPSATTKTFTSSSNSGSSTPKSAPSKQVSTSEITATTATVTSIPPKATTPPSLLPPPPTTKVATPPPSSSSSTILSNTSMVMATSKAIPPVLVPTSTVSPLENDFNFRIPKRNLDSDSQESRMKMVKIDVQSSKSESKPSDLVKADPSKKSDTAAKKSSPLPPPPPEHSFASNKGNKVSKELKLLSTKAGQTCHDNNTNPTPSAAVDENSTSRPNSNDKNGKENLSVPAITFSSNVSSVSSKDMTKTTNASSSNSTPLSSSSAVVQSSSASKLSSSSSGASSAANITDPRLTVPATTSSSLSTSSNSTFTGDSSRSSSSSSSTSNSKRSSDAIKSGRPPAKVQLTPNSKHKSSANSYFQEATRMKHEGNKKTDIFEKSFLYMQSVVYYVQSGIAMEKSRKEQDCQKMFSETLELLGQIGHYHQYQQEQKLSVLRLLLMSAICKKLYDVKKKVAENLRQVLDEHYKQSSSSTSTTNVHTPSPVRPNLNISTPSSRSTPSPSGSIDSIRSQGSSTSDARLTPSATSANSSSSTAAATNITSSSMPSSSISPHVSSGTSSSSSSSQTLVIPKRIHSITRNYIDIMDYLAKANHYSEQAAIQRDSCKDFIELLNSRCKTISWQSSISEHVDYVKAGLQLLQDS